MSVKQGVTGAVVVAIPLLVCAVASQCWAQQFVNQFNRGSVSGSPGSPNGINWDVPTRRAGTFQAFSVDSQWGRIDRGALNWNVGLASPTLIDLSADGSWQGASLGFIHFYNELTVTLTAPADFVLTGSLQQSGGAGAGLLIEPLTGAIFGVPTGPNGELRFGTSSTPTSLNVAGVLAPGNYRISLGAGVAGVEQQSFAHALSLSIPSPGPATVVGLALCAWMRRRRG